MGQRLVRINTSITRRQKEWLAQQARAFGVSETEIMRRSLDDVIQRNEGRDDSGEIRRPFPIPQREQDDRRY